MANRTLPRTDAALLHWSASFLKRASQDPQAIGLDAQQLAEFADARAAFAAAMTVAAAPATRTTVSVLAKNEAAARLRAIGGRLTAIVRACPAAGDVQQYELGIAVRRPSSPRRAAPATAPSVAVTGVQGRTVTARLDSVGDAGTVTLRRGRADGAIGAILFSCVGDAFAAREEDWRFEGVTSATHVTVTFGADVPAGSPVGLVAAWLGPTLERGPTSHPAQTHLAGGGLTVALGLRRAA